MIKHPFICRMESIDLDVNFSNLRTLKALNGIEESNLLLLKKIIIT